MHQESLWHDTIEEALRAVVVMLGGPKRVAGQLWPSKSITEGARFLNHCLDPERPEKLSLDELQWLLREGRLAGVHTAMSFLASAAGYNEPQPKNPETERDKLQREFIASVQAQQRLLKQMEALGGL